MAAAGEPLDRAPFRALGLLLGMFSVGFLILAAYWVSNCVPTGGGPYGPVVCAYPDVAEGYAAAAIAIVLFVPALALVLPSTAERGSREPEPSPEASTLVAPEHAPGINRPTRCHYCGAVTSPPGSLCRSCRRPLAWSNAHA